MNNKSKFNFYERVKIINPLTDKKKKQNLQDALGTVMSKGQNENGSWGYGVSIDKENGLLWSCDENELESLGTFAKREDYYSGESIRVGVTKDGKGYIIENKNDSK